MSRGRQQWQPEPPRRPSPENFRWSARQSVELWLWHVCALGRGDVEHARNLLDNARRYSRAVANGLRVQRDRAPDGREPST